MRTDPAPEPVPVEPLLGEPLVGVIMGSKSDYGVMRAAVEILREFGVPYEAKVVSAHRTPELMFKYAGEAASRGLRVIIAGAGGAAHLPGMVAARTTLPVLGVPIAATALQGMDALLSIVQMPKGIPVGTLAIGAPGAANAGLLAVQILASTNPELSAKLTAYREARRDEVLLQSLEDSKPLESATPLAAAEPLEASKVLEDSKSFNDPEPEVIR